MSLRFAHSLSVLLKKRLLSQRAQANQQAEQGLTLIECLVAMIIITLTVVAITPPVFIATATRVQSRRAQQANQIAQAEVDRVRTIMERANFTRDQLPAEIGRPTDFTTVASPSAPATEILSLGACGTYPPVSTGGAAITPVPATSFIPVDVDGDCTPEYIMQVFRTDGCVPADIAARSATLPPPSSFTMGVRVYSFNPNEPLPPLGTDRAALALTTGKRDGGVAGQVRQPLQVLISKVTQSGVAQAIECATQGNN
jgi:prepilin-type N-terminal cleavage/methylation domain-containing protein